LREFGAVYLNAIGGAAQYYARTLEEVKGVYLMEFGIPVQQPIGGHAVFVDAKRFLPGVREEEFQAQTLAVELYIEGGVRGVEIGTLLADRDPATRENRFPELEFLRLAFPEEYIPIITWIILL